MTNQRIHNSALIPQHSFLAVALGALLFALSFPAEAQQPTKVPRIGVLRTGSHSDPLIDAFRQGLRELGYIEGKNVFVEYRWAEDRAPAAAKPAAALDDGGEH